MTEAVYVPEGISPYSLLPKPWKRPVILSPAEEEMLRETERRGLAEEDATAWAYVISALKESKEGKLRRLLRGLGNFLLPKITSTERSWTKEQEYQDGLIARQKLQDNYAAKERWQRLQKEFTRRVSLGNPEARGCLIKAQIMTNQLLFWPQPEGPKTAAQAHRDSHITPNPEIYTCLIKTAARNAARGVTARDQWKAVHLLQRIADHSGISYPVRHRALGALKTCGTKINLDQFLLT
jgi:hypothetical protein